MFGHIVHFLFIKLMVCADRTTHTGYGTVLEALYLYNNISNLIFSCTCRCVVALFMGLF